MRHAVHAIVVLLPVMLPSCRKPEPPDMAQGEVLFAESRFVPRLDPSVDVKKARPEDYRFKTVLEWTDRRLKLDPFMVENAFTVLKAPDAPHLELVVAETAKGREARFEIAGQGTAGRWIMEIGDPGGDRRFQLRVAGEIRVGGSTAAEAFGFLSGDRIGIAFSNPGLETPGILGRLEERRGPALVVRFFASE